MAEKIEVRITSPDGGKDFKMSRVLLTIGGVGAMIVMFLALLQGGEIGAANEAVSDINETTETTADLKRKLAEGWYSLREQEQIGSEIRQAELNAKNAHQAYDAHTEKSARLAGMIALLALPTAGVLGARALKSRG